MLLFIAHIYQAIFEVLLWDYVKITFSKNILVSDLACSDDSCLG